MSISVAIPTEAEIINLLNAASEVAARAYAPYSHFRVGAALLPVATGDIVTGCNVENASYRLTVCAEQAAVAAAVARDGPAVRIRALAIVNLNGAACQPCGACRQTLLEFSTSDTLVIYPGSEGRAERRFLGDLMPFSFTLCAG